MRVSEANEYKFTKHADCSKSANELNLLLLFNPHTAKEPFIKQVWQLYNKDNSCSDTLPPDARSFRKMVKYLQQSVVQKTPELIFYGLNFQDLNGLVMNPLQNIPQDVSPKIKFIQSGIKLIEHINMQECPTYQIIRKCSIMS